jgi:hypothetical protein
MTPERVAELVERWVRLYTSGLPELIRQRRVNELAADLHDQIEHERARSTSERRIALHIVLRMVRGLPADVTWRGQHKVQRPIRTIVLATAGVLAVPLLAMQVTDEVAWGVADFVLAGTLIMATCLLVAAAARKTSDLAYRAAVAVAMAAAFLLIWVNLAVGVITEPNDLANVMYIGVLAVGAVGAAVARFRAQGMARALVATAVVQASVAGIALVAGRHRAPGSSIAEILVLNAGFVGLFIGSALLFRHAAVQRRSPDGRPQQ